LQQGNVDGARIYAANSIRKKSESLNLLRLASRIDAVASRVETATTMRQVTGNMTSVVKGMDKAMETMNLERVRVPHSHSTAYALINNWLIQNKTICTDITGDG
jgi:charged multivesicular body protein 1